MLTRRRFIAELSVCCGTCSAFALGARIRSAAAAAAEIDGPGYNLRFVGAQRETIMMGERDAVLDLRSLARNSSLFGVGPLAGLTGEVTIAAGRPSLARIGAARSVEVTESFDAGVPFFVWAEISGWQSIPLPREVRSYADLEAFAPEAAARAGLRQPFPFLIEGRPEEIDFHIVDAKPDTPPGMEAHAKIQIPFTAHGREAVLVGFWSDRHQGIFTPMGSNIHVHFQTRDNKLSGHVQGLSLPSGQMMRLPRG